MGIQAIFTGGTIGGQIGADGRISASGDSVYLILDLYEKQYGNEVTFTTAEPYTILSENLKAEHLMLLIQSVRDALKNPENEGIIIMHGTDTLQYSAAVLEYVFGDAQIPIVLVSSDFVLTDARANGMANFAAAVDFIRGHYGEGVFVSYRNENEAPTIHRGTRLQSSVSFSSSVSSIMDSWYGRFEDGVYVSNPDYQVDASNSKSMFPVNKEKVFLEDIADTVLRIQAYPGMKYPVLAEGSAVKVVLLESYHSGTICIDEELEKFAKKAKEEKVLVYLTGLTDQEAEYETVEMYRKLGIIPLINSAPIAQYCKAWLAADNNKEIISAMGVSIGEDKAC